MMQGLKATINANGQITIPVVFRLFYGMRPGDEFEVLLGKLGKLELRLVTRREPWEKLPLKPYKKKSRPCVLCGKLT